MKFLQQEMKDLLPKAVKFKETENIPLKFNSEWSFQIQNLQCRPPPPAPQQTLFVSFKIKIIILEAMIFTHKFLSILKHFWIRIPLKSVKFSL